MYVLEFLHRLNYFFFFFSFSFFFLRCKITYLMCQTRVCRNNFFVSTKIMLVAAPANGKCMLTKWCRDKITFVATKYFCRDKYLSPQRYGRDITYLSREAYFWGTNAWLSPQLSPMIAVRHRPHSADWVCPSYRVQWQSRRTFIWKRSVYNTDTRR